MNNTDWNAVADAIRKTSPDAYHIRYAAGATDHQIGLGMYRGPSDPDTPWDTYDAYCQHHAYPSDRYALESLVLGFVRGIQKIAMGLLDRPSKEVYSDNGIETFGTDLFNEGLQAAVVVIGRRREFDHVGPGDLDEVTQLRRIVFRAARNRMMDFLERAYPERWRTILSAGLPQDDEFFDKDAAPPTSCVTDGEIGVEPDDAAHRRAEAAIQAACTCEADKSIVELRASGYSQQEIAERLGLSRDQVQRALDRILKKAEELLDLPHTTTTKRKSRKKSSDVTDDEGDRATN